MHAPNDKHKTGYRTEPKSGVGFLILMVAVPVVLLALAILQPKASVWISQAAQAEFVSGAAAQPDMAVPVQTVRGY